MKERATYRRLSSQDRILLSLRLKDGGPATLRVYAKISD
jgi:hypothetical protein